MSGGLPEVAAAARSLGLGDGSATLIGQGSNVLVDVGGGVVGRLGRPGTVEVAARAVAVARWLLDEGVDAVRPVEGVVQPILADDGRPVTWWLRLPPHRPSRPGELGHMLRTIHGLTAPAEPQLPVVEPLAGFESTITAAPFLTVVERGWLLDHLHRLGGAWAAVRRHRSGPDRVIHGDAWQGNVVASEDGRLIVLDLDGVVLGPPEWDLINLAADRVDFGRVSEDEYDEFVAGYGGYDVRDWDHFRDLADVCEMRWVTFAIARATAEPRFTGQVRHRIDCLRGIHPRPWSWPILQ